MENDKFEMLYAKAMRRSRDALTLLSTDIDPIDPQYKWQIKRVFSALSHCLALANRDGSSGTATLLETSMFCRCLTTMLHRECLEEHAFLFTCFVKIWPLLWRNLGMALIPRITGSIPISVRFRIFSRNQLILLLNMVTNLPGKQNSIIPELLTTPGFTALVLEIWANETEDGEDRLDTDLTMAKVVDNIVVHLVIIGNFDDLVAPLTWKDLNSLAATALKHVVYASRLPLTCKAMHHLITALHIVTILSAECRPTAPLFQAQHRMAIVTRVLFDLTREPPVSFSEGIAAPVQSDKAWAIVCALINISTGVSVTDSIAWLIEALELDLLNALVCCEPWERYLVMPNPAEECLYPFLTKILPAYSVYRSCLVVMDRHVTKIQRLGLDAAARQSGLLSPFWKAWDEFITLVESRKAILASVIPGGLIDSREECHNATCHQKNNDWNLGHRIDCQELQSSRSAGHIPNLSQADVDFLNALVQSECDTFRLEFPLISRNQQRNSKLWAVVIDFCVCPPERALVNPRKLLLCRTHEDKALIDKWTYLVNHMDTLVNPTVMFYVEVMKGERKIRILRLSELVGEGDEEKVEKMLFGNLWDCFS